VVGIAMIIPKLDPSKRDREFKQRNFEEISQIVHTWLFTNDVGHIEMDKDILGLEPLSSKGWQSMGVLHYLGLKREFKGIFHNSELNQAIRELKSDEQDFSFIIELLENTAADYGETFVQSLYQVGKSQDKDFEQHYKLRLQEIKDTDGQTNQTQSRKEQGILRGILFKSVSEAKCAICHRTFPTDIMVAAHIKPRSKCSTKERKNPNVVMPVCKVGCDDFFEKGYLIVDKDGVVRLNEKMTNSVELQTLLNSLTGNLCTHFNNKTKDFFSYKRNSLEQG
jgi:hypothetical protein